MLAIILAGIGLLLVGFFALRRAKSTGARVAAALAILLGVGCLLGPWLWIAYEPSRYSAPVPRIPDGEHSAPLPGIPDGDRPN